MSRLVVVSNRVGSRSTGAGGLAVALADAIRDRHGLWFGWSGKNTGEKKPSMSEESWRRFSLVQMDLTEHEYSEFYLGFSNRCLWPLLHFRADLMDYQASLYKSYRRVNARFAAALCELLQPDDLIWVHDFHLLPLASELRALGVQQRIGFFLHTPFPPRDILTALPPHHALAKSLFDYDLVGFQSASDMERFTDYACAEHNAQLDGETLKASFKQLEVGSFPIGIDTQQVTRYAFSASGEREFRHMREALRGRQQIIGVDRLDYTKGIRRRMAAFELMLEKYPEAQKQVEFLQISPLSRGELKAYRDFRNELERAALSINTRFGQVDWTPVRYLNRVVPRQPLAAIYRASHIGLVTPMRDGMNLVAKEYVAAQDPDDPGVLVLSRFAGTAQQMEAALLINPYDTEEVADAIQRARSMNLSERRERHAVLMKQQLQNGARDWAASFLRRLSLLQLPVAAQAQAA